MTKEVAVDHKEEMRTLALAASRASRTLALAGREIKDRFLLAYADALEREAPAILEANARDVAGARAHGQTAALVDRLTLTAKRIAGMALSLREVAALPDPVGEVSGMWLRPNGLYVGRMRVPLGVVAIIYEARPNVTSDAVGLCLKSGNAVILRGGTEALASNLAIAGIASRVLRETGLPEESVRIVPTGDREAVSHLLKLDHLIDLVVPRGGESLIRRVVEESTIPVIKHYKGLCHVYVDRDADLTMAREICFNAKVQRPGVCNAMESMLVHRAVAEEFLPPMLSRLAAAGVEIRGCPSTRRLFPAAVAATEADYDTEYLDLVLSVRVVEDYEQAVEHIARHGSGHSEAIVTRDLATARRFTTQVDASCVFVNASTRFNDGFELGLGAELGISTQKLHSRGPMGLEDLTCRKFIVFGEGQVRG
jgi:glutamate-5-semialdehyde dehydrogenase